MAGILGTGIQDGLLLKPVKYQWAMDLYDQAVANTWFPNEIQLVQDLADWKKMSDEERHAVTFLRWRPDREPESCRVSQIDVAPAYDLAQVLTD